jgi:hypothetical protein
LPASSPSSAPSTRRLRSSPSGSAARASRPGLCPLGICALSLGGRSGRSPHRPQRGLGGSSWRTGRAI